MANSPLPGYSQPWGAKQIWIGQHTGPALYAAGGENFAATGLGMGGFDRVSGSQSWNANNTGNYSVQVLYPVKNGGATSSVKLKWVAANGSEAANNTDLSAEYVRLEVIGV